MGNYIGVIIMATKSNLVRGLLFGAEFFTEVQKELKMIGLTEEKMFEVVERKFKTASGLAKEVVKLLIKEDLNTFLKLISIEPLILAPTDGTKNLANAKNLFEYIDLDFENWGTDEKGLATEATPVQVYKMTKDANFQQMFGSLSSDPSKLCLTQAQIIEFVEKHRNWLRTDGYATFFLFESNKKFFVALVCVDSDGALRVFVHRFESSDVCDVEYRRRLVVPQLAV